jgi:hypothetical protein
VLQLKEKEEDLQEKREMERHHISLEDLQSFIVISGLMHRPLATGFQLE